jgi:hypothetical protein
MFTRTKSAASVAIVLGILGTASAALAAQDKASAHARGSYAQADYVRPSPNVNPNPSTKPTGAVRSVTRFEKWWLDYQSHGGR